MNKISRICGVAVVMFVCAIRLDAQSPVIKLDSLSIWNASRIALQYNPQIRAARSGIEFSEGGLRLNRSNYYPNISANASAQRTEGAFVLNPAISAREQKYNSYSAGITLNQLIYDFGKTAGRVSSSESLLEASSYDYKASQENVLVNVQTNYFSYLQAQFILKVNEETVKQAEEHLKVARAFFNAGTRPEYDVTKAEVDLANANVTVIRSRNAVQIAKLQLDNSMGIQTSDDYTLVDSFRISPNKINLDSARIIAFENRSELKSLNLRLASNESLVSAAWDNNLPTLSASGSYNWNGFDLPLASRWVFGLNFSL
ncbi:MAG: TolC family protein, partial [Methanococcaceae archaeon]